jgi:hypothetical protein
MQNGHSYDKQAIRTTNIRRKTRGQRREKSGRLGSGKCKHIDRIDRNTLKIQGMTSQTGRKD